MISLILDLNFGLSTHALNQWFPNYAPRHTAAPPDVIRCAAKTIEIKINQVEFMKFHPANFCQYSTLSILVVVIRYAAQCLNRTRNYMHFSKQKNMNVAVNIFNVNFDFQDWNIWQRYLHILIASTQACKAEKKTSLLHQISWLRLKRKL